MQKIVIDTNIFISYLISKAGFSFKIVEGIVFDKQASFFVSKPILDEYFEVFHRNRFLKIRSDFFDSANVLYDNIIEFSHHVIPSQTFDLLTDKSDNKFLELAYTVNADFIITGNKLHFTFADFYNTKIVSPKEYWENYKP